MISGGEVSFIARAIAPGLVVMALIYSIGNVSGAHINPAVTFAFALRSSFSWKLAPYYWAAQLAGSVVAAGLLRVLFGNIKELGASTPHYNATVALTMEAILAFFLILVILSTAKRSKILEPIAAIPVGRMIAVCGLFAKPISDSSMNPARSLGPIIVSASMHHTWIYWLGPFIGASVAFCYTVSPPDTN